jgi:hypothetical protein
MRTFKVDLTLIFLLICFGVGAPPRCALVRQHPDLWRRWCARGECRALAKGHG